MIDLLIVLRFPAVRREEQQVRLQRRAWFCAKPRLKQDEAGRRARMVTEEADALRLEPVLAQGTEQVGQPLRAVYQKKIAAETEQPGRGGAEV